MPEQFQAFVDQGVSPPGTSLASATLNGLVIAQSCLITGGIPPTSGSLVLTQPATTAVVNTGSAAAYVAPTSQALTFTASRDTYVDLNTSGVYTLVAVANNAAAPAVTTNSARLYKAVSGASAVTSVLPLIPNAGTTNSGPTPVSALAVAAPDETSGTYSTAVTTAYPFAATDTLQQTIWRLVKQAAIALLQTIVGYDATEAVSTGGSSSLLDNMNHVRQAIATAIGGTWSAALANTKAAILSDGTNSGAAVTVNRLYRRPTGTPTITSAGGGSSGALSTSASFIIGNDEHGALVLVTGASGLTLNTNASATLTVTFSAAYPGIPDVVVSPQTGWGIASGGQLVLCGIRQTTTNWLFSMNNIGTTTMTFAANIQIGSVGYIIQY